MPSSSCFFSTFTLSELGAPTLHGSKRTLICVCHLDIWTLVRVIIVIFVLMHPTAVVRSIPQVDLQASGCGQTRFHLTRFVYQADDHFLRLSEFQSCWLGRILRARN